MIRCFAYLFALLPILAAQTAQGQVSVDFSKITCEQYVVMPKADSVAVWLSGYYHGGRRDPVIDVNKFEDSASNFRAACMRPENFKKPIMQLIEANMPK